jgi:eukaryotic-like serine/threonine-protein kinase
MIAINKTKQALLLFLVVLVLVQTALPTVQAADEWSMFRHDLNHTGQTETGETTNSAQLLWRHPTNRGIYSSPAVANGRLFVGSRDSQVYCINVSTGMPIWRRALGWEIWSSPAIDQKRVYIGIDNGSVYALSIADGSIVWATQIGNNEVRSSPAIVDGKIFIGSGTGGLYCLNSTDGQIIWMFPTELQVNSSPAVVDGIVYFACEDFELHAVNASTGAMIWHKHTASMRSSPSVFDGRVYVGSVDGYIFCLNASNGDNIWQYQTIDQVESSPAVAYGNVYFGSNSGSLYCLNASDGSLVWQSSTSYWVDSSPVVADGNVYVGSQDRNIYCFDAYTGEQKWHFETYNQIHSSPTIVNNTLYVCSYDFIIYAFALTNSGIKNLPNPDNIELGNLNMVAFDAVAVAIVAGIIVGFVLIYRKDHQKSTTPTNGQSWFKTHTDAVAILVILAFSAVFFVFLGNGSLWASDEQTYSQWAFHMNQSGDYWSPWGYGDLNFWIAKPPLYMWLMSLSYQVFGFSNFSTRLVSPVFGILTLIMVYYLGKLLFNRKVGFISAIVLGTFATFFSFSGHAMTDVMFVFFIVSSIYFILLSEKGQRSNWYAALAGAFFGLALMTKQIQAFLLPLIVVSYFLVTKKSPRFLFTKRFALFIGVGLLIFLPWVIYMMLRFDPLFSQWYFMYSGIVRAITPIENHENGVFFYIANIIIGENPIWVAALPFGIGLSVYGAVTKKSKSKQLLVVWLVVVLGLFTVAQTKIFWYILPVFPAFALAIGSFLYELSVKVQKKRRCKGV